MATSVHSAISAPPKCQTWSLERYARLTSPSVLNDARDAKWEQFDNTSERLELTLTSTAHILVHSGKKQLENISLSGASSNMKGVSKGDSILLFYRTKEDSRRFRVKFSSAPGKTAEVMCRMCVDSLAQYFPIKVELPVQTSGEDITQKSGVSTASDLCTLQDDVTLPQLAQAITKSGNVRLPPLYSSFHVNDDMDINTMVKLFLSEASFPAFVEQVEKELGQIMK